MKTISTEEYAEFASKFDVRKPEKGKIDDNYFGWHKWRVNAVKRALIAFAIKLRKMGFDVIVPKGDENSPIARNLFFGHDDIMAYIQYHDLLHSIGDTDDNFLSIDDDMNIIADEEEINNLYNITRKRNNKHFKVFSDLYLKLQ